MEAILQYQRDPDNLCRGQRVQTLQREIQRDVLEAYTMSEPLVANNLELYSRSKSFVGFLFEICRVPRNEKRSPHSKCLQTDLEREQLQNRMRNCDAELESTRAELTRTRTTLDAVRDELENNRQKLDEARAALAEKSKDAQTNISEPHEWREMLGKFLDDIKKELAVKFSLPKDQEQKINELLEKLSPLEKPSCCQTTIDVDSISRKLFDKFEEFVNRMISDSQYHELLEDFQLENQFKDLLSHLEQSNGQDWKEAIAKTQADITGIVKSMITKLQMIHGENFPPYHYIKRTRELEMQIIEMSAQPQNQILEYLKLHEPSIAYKENWEFELIGHLERFKKVDSEIKSIKLNLQIPGDQHIGIQDIVETLRQQGIVLETNLLGAWTRLREIYLEMYKMLNIDEKANAIVNPESIPIEFFNRVKEFDKELRQVHEQFTITEIDDNASMPAIEGTANAFSLPYTESRMVATTEPEKKNASDIEEILRIMGISDVANWKQKIVAEYFRLKSALLHSEDSNTQCSEQLQMVEQSKDHLLEEVDKLRREISSCHEQKPIVLDQEKWTAASEQSGNALELSQASLDREKLVNEELNASLNLVRTQNEALISENLKLKHDVVNLENELINIRDSNNALENDFKRCQNKLDDCLKDNKEDWDRKQKSALSREREEFRLQREKDLDEYTEEMTRCESRIKEMNRQLIECQDENQNLIAEMSELKERNVELEEYFRETEHLKQRLQETQRNAEERLELEKKRLEKELAEAEGMNEKYREELRQTLSEKGESIQTCLDQLEQTQKSFTTCNKERTRLNGQLQDVQESLRERDNEILDLKQKMASAMQKMETVSGQLNDCKQEKAKLESEFESKMKQAADAITGYNTEKDSLEQFLKETRDQLDQAQQSYDSERKARDQLTLRLQKAKESVAEKDGEMSRLKQRLEETQRKIDTVSNELKDCERLRGDITIRYEEEITSLRKSLKETNDKLCQVRESFGTCSRDKNQLTLQLQGAEKSLKEKQEEIVDLKEKVSRVQRNLERVAGKLKSCKEEKKALEKDLNNKLKEAKDGIDQCKREKASLQKIVNQTEGALANVQQSYDECSREKSRLTVALQNAEQSLGEMSQLSRGLEKAQEDIGTLSARLNNCNTEKNALESTLEQRNILVAELNGKLKEAEVQRGIAEKDSLQVSLSNRSEQITALIREKGELQQYLNDFEARYKDIKTQLEDTRKLYNACKLELEARKETKKATKRSTQGNECPITERPQCKLRKVNNYDEEEGEWETKYKRLLRRYTNLENSVMSQSQLVTAFTVFYQKLFAMYWEIKWKQSWPLPEDLNAEIREKLSILNAIDDKRSLLFRMIINYMKCELKLMVEGHNPLFDQFVMEVFNIQQHESSMSSVKSVDDLLERCFRRTIEWIERRILSKQYGLTSGGNTVADSLEGCFDHTTKWMHHSDMEL